MRKYYIFSVLISAFLLSLNLAEARSWKFVVFGDSHVPSSDTLMEMIPYIEQENPDLIFVVGDLVDGGLKCTASELQNQLNIWKIALEPLRAKGIKIYAIRGNHEDDAKDDIEVWRQVFADDWQLPQNGPAGEEDLTYSVTHKNAKFIGLDNYVNIHTINQAWLDAELSNANEPHIFVFAHEAAFKVFHTDCLDDSVAARDKFWQSLASYGVKSFFCGHDHFYNAARIDDGDGNTANDVFQFLIGSGGGWLMPKHNLNGANSSYKPIELIHKIEHGYGIVEVSGETADDLNVSITWKGRTYDAENNKYTYTAINEVVFYVAEQKFPSYVASDNSEYFLSPNPATNYIHFAETVGYIQIISTLGQIEWQGEIPEAGTINISSLPIGIYYVIMKSGTKIHNAKLIKVD